MADTFTIRVDSRQVDRTLQELGPKGSIACMRALNRTGATMKTRTVRAIAADTGLAQKVVRDGVKLERATASRLMVTLAARAKRIALYAFKARQTRKGVTYRLPGGRGLAPGAFITKMPSGHVGVFKRRTRRRLPIDELRGPSLGRVFKKILGLGLLRETAALLRKNLRHEISFLLTGRGTRT